MVAALEDRLPATGVALHGVAVIKHFIAGFNQQEVAIGGDLWRLERAQLGDVRLGKFKFFTRVEVALSAKILL